MYISLIFMLLFSIYNRILGALKHSLWHETISIYYIALVIIKSFIIFYLNKSKQRKNDLIIFRISKILLVLLNLFLIIPIILMVYNKRVVEISFNFSIAIAVYVTIKTIKSITTFIKNRKETDVLVKQLKTIDLIDTIVSILTLQNTLIFINSTSYDSSLYYLSLISSIVGFALNLFLVFRQKKCLR